MPFSDEIEGFKISALRYGLLRKPTQGSVVCKTNRPPVGAGLRCMFSGCPDYFTKPNARRALCVLCPSLQLRMYSPPLTSSVPRSYTPRTAFSSASVHTTLPLMSISRSVRRPGTSRPSD
ncbi:MAG: hypothetical protein N2050_03060, partial [Flavobacteriales bacterium]|nr:hypothetical protein [Flavobacteriales bacterium]